MLIALPAQISILERDVKFQKYLQNKICLIVQTTETDVNFLDAVSHALLYFFRTL